MAKAAPAKKDEAPVTEATEATNVPAVVENQNTSLAPVNSMDDMLAQYSGAGSENVTQKDMQVPFLRIVQSLSKERHKTESVYIQGAEEGDIFNTVSRQLWKGDKDTKGSGIILLPITYSRRYTEWWPRNSQKGKGLVKDWGTDEQGALRNTTRDEKGRNLTPNGTEVVESGDFVVMTVDPKTGDFAPAVLSLAKTQLKKARQWNSLLMNVRANVGGRSIKPPFWYSAWMARTQSEKNEHGAWNGWVFEAYGLISDLPNGAEIFRSCADFYESLRRGEVKVGVDVDGAEESTGSNQPRQRQPGEDETNDDIPF